jgi:nitroimidazol reductase NimA-like FMN-containing flavoprotein (pyridoxamine 5'-phosphate oxidase superfamily)
MIGELRPDEIESVLRRHHIGRLACVVDGEPYLVPITFAYRDGFIYCHTMPGQKLDALRADPSVAFEVDERWEADTWRSVVVRGVFEELPVAERDAALGTLRGAYPDASRTAESGVAFRIRPTELTGRAVHRSALIHPLADTATPLQGVDLRAGDEANYPSREDD